jgi:DNA-binding transcriptional LysR family regulator
MDLRWLEDLEALAEAGTLTRAAEMRNITQPAFTRRIQHIEQWLGAPVLDRSRRPARLTPAVLRKLVDIRALLGDLRGLRRDIREWDSAQRRVAIAAQHSISSGLLPRFISRIQDARPSLSIRLRSANRDECYSLLMTRQVTMLIAYEADGLPVVPDETLIERLALGEDELCPVASAGLASAIRQQGDRLATVKIVGFPSEVFFGAVLAREVLPGLQTKYRLRITCETALVPAALTLALESAGVAWLPRSLCDADIRAGRLIEMGDLFGKARMKIVCARLATPRTQDAETVWSRLAIFMAERAFEAIPAENEHEPKRGARIPG